MWVSRPAAGSTGVVSRWGGALAASRWRSVRNARISTEQEKLPAIQQSTGRAVFDARVPREFWGARLDTWISEQIPGASRAKIQDSIRKGLATVNGRVISKPSYVVDGGDRVVCSFAAPAPSEALPENIKLDVVHEDEHLIVINKSADMVVHPAPGHPTGTLVNAVLYHCGLPPVRYSRQKKPRPQSDSSEAEALEEEQEEEEDELGLTIFYGPDPAVRPGIVHRLDKGTSGLIVVAKDEHTHADLGEQFKARTVRRAYLSISCGTPSPMNGRIEAPILRDARDRKRMAVAENESEVARARFAASRYKLMEPLAQGGASLVEWKLETGRTHQIRVHAQCLGYPIVGDETYGATERFAASMIGGKLSTTQSKQALQRLLSEVTRPCLHAYSLGFLHPWTKKQLDFTRPPPEDFEKVWKQLRELA